MEKLPTHRKWFECFRFLLTMNELLILRMFFFFFFISPEPAKVWNKNRTDGCFGTKMWHNWFLDSTFFFQQWFIPWQKYVFVVVKQTLWERREKRKFAFLTSVRFFSVFIFIKVKILTNGCKKQFWRLNV